ncbi:MAG TPA: GNAT family N-acetyltransferase [Chitinophagaceae bacterium]|nr:GNAT family N-acetyltransferase [Chitinophagaceae bacterium]
MFKILPAGEPDIPLIRDLTLRIWPATYGSILSAEQMSYMLEWMYSPASLQQQMQAGARFLLVLDQEEPVGFASFQQMSPGHFKLHKLYVLPSQQGRGTGRFLVETILEECRRQGGQSLVLQVNRHNQARGFYERLGFRVTGEADFDIGGGYYMNDYIMERTL